MDPAKPVFLDDKIISQPAAALQLVAKEILRVSEMVKVVVADTITIVKTEDLNELEPLQEKGVQIKKLTDQITEYLPPYLGRNNDRAAGSTDGESHVHLERCGTYGNAECRSRKMCTGKGRQSVQIYAGSDG